MAWAVWCRTARGGQEWLTAIFTLESEARWYAEAAQREGRPVRPLLGPPGEYRCAGAVAEPHDPDDRLGYGRQFSNRP